ncbi:MAG TPA: hypothetical protein VNI57_02430 [Candidatus Saccharimonadales bacterium]|nr:hypothetical protein [Candidatus Saccharimonadales bacterium]
MRRSNIFGKAFRKLAPFFLLSLLVTLQPASVAWGWSQGRNYAQCVITCNSMQRECKAACRSDCNSLFGPGHHSDRRDCLRACYSDCRDVRQSCHDDCRGIKPPPSDNQP